MLNSRSLKGVTLIELAVTLTVFSISLGFAVPAFSNWIANAKVRSVAEALQNGVRAAQTEAVKRNRQTAFVLTNATPALNATPIANGKNWYIQVLDTNTPFVQGGSFGNLAAGVTVNGPDAVICFNSVGRLVTNMATGLGVNCTAPSSMTTYEISKTGADRTLQIQVGLGGKIRMCDKSKTLSATNPDGC